MTQSELSKVAQQIAEQVAQGKGPREVARWLDAVKGLDSGRAATYSKYVAELEASGLSDAEVARRAEAMFNNLLKDRKEVIAQTEMRKATSEVKAEEARLRGDKFKVWQTVGDDRVSDECQACEAQGPIPIGDNFTSGNGEPPNHPRCLVPETPIFAPDKWSAFVTTYSGPVVKILISNGSWLTVTPNHMLLTPQGFIMAKHLREGDNVLYSPFAQRVATSHPDYNDGPSRIDKVVSTLSESVGVSTVAVPLSAEDLHGDAGLCNGYVNIVSPVRFLGDTGKPASIEECLALDFNVADSELFGLSCLSNFASMLLALGLAFDSSMGVRREAQAVINAHALHPEFHGITAGTDCDVVLCQDSSYDVTGDTEVLADGKNGIAPIEHRTDFVGRDLCTSVSAGDLVGSKNLVNQRDTDLEPFSNILDRFASDIEIASIVSIEWLNFSGHVYDLQCYSTLYTANGVLSSNCRCTVNYYSNPALTDVYKRDADARAARTAAAKADE